MNDHRGCVRAARVAGVKIFIHWSWLIIGTLISLSFWGQLGNEYPGLRDASIWVLAVFGSVVFFASVLVHELAHAFVAKSRGSEVKSITLYLFGGATEADAALTLTLADEEGTSTNTTSPSSTSPTTAPTTGPTTTAGTATSIPTTTESSTSSTGVGALVVLARNADDLITGGQVTRARFASTGS